MDPQAFLQLANTVTKLKMYPYFDVANYILMSLMVRDDNHPQTTGSQLFSRKHPLSSWVGTMLLCFGGSIICNLLVGEPLILVFKDHQALLTASIVWYCVNFSPFDIIYRVFKLMPFKLVIYTLKEFQRANKVNHGVAWAMNKYPGSYVVIAIIGVIKGSASRHMIVLQRLFCGNWQPTKNEFLAPSFVSKGSLVAAIVFILERKGFIDAPHAIVYFCVVIFFVHFRLMSLLIGFHDPFVPIENLFCAVFMGGMWDAMRRAVTKEKTSSAGGEAAMGSGSDLRNGIKNKEEKKND